VSKYNAPSCNALPSLSNVGSVALAPKNLSSKLSNAASAAACAVCAAVALLEAFVACVVAVDADVAALLSDVDAFDADVAAAVALFAALVALVAAALADDVADAASTNKSHLALSVFEDKGCEPDDVCAVLEM